MATAKVSVWRLLGVVWKPLRRLTEETRLQRRALEQIAVELKTIRLHLLPEDLPEQEDTADDTPISFTTNAEQVALERIESDLFRADGRPPTEDEIVNEYARRLSVGVVAGQVGDLGRRLRGRDIYSGGPLPSGDRPAGGS